jgi:hypothetical protein
MRLPLRNDLSPVILGLLEELFLSICERHVRESIIEEHLTASERQILRNRVCHATDIVTVIAKQRRQSVERTVLELAKSCGLVDPIRYHRVCRGIEESPTHIKRGVTVAERKCDRSRPFFDEAEGRLWFRGRTVRRVRVCRIATTCQLILTAFESADWISPIPNPFLCGPEQSVSQVIHHLNTGLRSIRFRSQKSGEEIAWEVSSK